MADDYEVGYGKPPAQHRFKPGNQAARKRGGRGKKREPVVTLESIVKNVLNARHKAKRGDAIVTVSTGKFVEDRLTKMFTSGTDRAVLAAIQILHRLTPEAPTATDPEPLEIHLTRAEGSRVELPPQSLWQEPQS